MKKLFLALVFAAFLFGGMGVTTDVVAQDNDQIVTVADKDNTPDKDKDKDCKKKCDKKTDKKCCDKKAEAKKECSDKKAPAKKECCDKKDGGKK